ncbi:MAG: YicC family protein [Clostridia bacterium]|nr:YicC family protein [Clostridia bacterium]MBR3196202.1 YicC family protein [Clostridia bacterium]
MALSMTGYGNGKAVLDGREVTVELKSVNHRYLDLSFRMPRNLLFLEDALRKQIQASLNRGHVEVMVSYRNTRSDAKELVCDEALAASYLKAAEKLTQQFGIVNDMTTEKLMLMPGVLTEQDAEDDQSVIGTLTGEAMGIALEGLCVMRCREGAALAQDLSQRCDVIRGCVSRIAERVPQIQSEIRERMTQKISEILENVRFDPERLEQEVVLIVERGSITEELVRLDSHMEQMKEILASQAPSVGRKLDFLVQEMNREINTIGSKSSDLQIANIVVQVKSEIEKIREQVQNIE